MNQLATNTIDPARIAAIVREVIARIKQSNLSANLQTDTATNPLPDKIITVATIESLSGSPCDVTIDSKAVVTPAARDEAKLRGITIRRSDAQPSTQNFNTEPSTQPTEIVDVSQPERAVSMLAQLARRGISSIGCKIVLSETPAADVFRFCHNENQRAVMLTSISDIPRFAGELQPTVWVLDMKRMNLMTAVNAAVQIAQKS
ncbi:hypothetical protein [Planctomycetes bacterium K23_9]|uniref:Uncharacterized protein n=1 Tax=Stieleria marina TaxID=1930275 RepID=A0A517P1B0_9BACT|nr:hypothetical protein K239x_51790 [Planctomycetes bacterium K23_9]